MRIFKRLYLYQCEKREKYFLISQCNASKILLFWLSVERKKVPKISRLSKHPLHLFRRVLSHIEKILPLGAKHCTFIYIQEFYIHEGNNNIMILLVFRRHYNVYVATAHPDSKELILNVICFHFLSKTDSRRRRPDPSFI